MKVKEPDLTEQIREIFGTTDAKELRQIAEDAACYRKKGNSANRSPVGKKIPCIQTDDLQSDKTCA